MAPTPLLRRVKGQWNVLHAEAGIRNLPPDSLAGNLYHIDAVRGPHVPYVFAGMFAFKWAVENDLEWSLRERDNPAAREVFYTLVDAVFLGVLQIRVIDTDTLGMLGTIVRANQGNRSRMALLYDGTRYVGGCHPDMPVYPGASLTMADWEALRDAVARKLEAVGRTGQTALKLWLRSHPHRVGEPSWLELLREHAGTPVPEGLHTVDLNATTIPAGLVPVSSTASGLKDFEFREYVGRVLVCAACGRNLSEEPLTFEMDNAGKVTCPCKESVALDFAGQGLFFDAPGGRWVIWNLRGGARPAGCTQARYEGTRATFTLGRCKIVVPGVVVDDDMLFCREVIAFRHPNHPPRYPDVPVRGDYFRFVGEGVKRLPVRGQEAQWMVPLQGQPTPITVTATVWTRDEDEASIHVWPNFLADNWRIYYLYMIAHGRLAERGLRLRPILADRRPAPFEIRSREMARLRQPVPWIEVVDDGGARGIFDASASLPKLAPRSATVSVALDFGTSNTCAAIRSQDGYRVLPFHDLSTDILSRHLGLGGVSGEWLPTYRPQEQGALRSLPSELLFDLPKSATSPGVDLLPPDEAYEGILKFCIPGPTIDKARWEEAIVSNFKWELGIGSQLRSHRARVREEYLRMFLHLVLAELTSQHSVGAISLVPTYPLSFGGAKHRDYVTSLERLAGIVRDDTGLSVNVVALVNESYAGRAHGMGMAGGLGVVIDLGGGSTDIAVTDDQQLVYVESLKYGGNNLLQILAKPTWRPTQWPGQASPRDDVRQVWLQRLIRTEGASVLLDQYDGRVPQVQALIERFFEGILTYVSLLIAARARAKDGKDAAALHVVLLGNGWSFLEALNQPMIRWVGDVLRRELGRLGTGYLQPDIHLPQGDADLERPMKEAVALGALKSQEPDPGDLDEAIRTIVGFDINVTIDGHNGPKLISRDDRIPTHPFSGRVMGVDACGLLAAIDPTWHGRTLSVTQNDVLQLNRQIMEDAVQRERRLNRSPFAVFLERQFQQILGAMH